MKRYNEKEIDNDLFLDELAHDIDNDDGRDIIGIGSCNIRSGSDFFGRSRHHGCCRCGGC